MLGRHIYRVEPVEGRWTIIKEGEDKPRAGFASRELAVAEARRLADAEPSKVILGDGDGIILEEELLGQDLSDELDP